ncbi:uncharacterized protein LOC131251546 isoform X2 [Magnolia sinica]|uniref:uncharacterized protein LOC131251546 isoform X2 n=1 Tax=Magnolia sinica TaxID=86752 RepID=UPI002659B3FD|nr:uncharacterized protein LOC131251546 isoform X2 [Magnolia sinica]
MNYRILTIHSAAITLDYFMYSASHELPRSLILNQFQCHLIPNSFVCGRNLQKYRLAKYLPEAKEEKKSSSEDMKGASVGTKSDPRIQRTKHMLHKLEKSQTELWVRLVSYKPNVNSG